MFIDMIENMNSKMDDQNHKDEPYAFRMIRKDLFS